jgi:hypothetical protein
MRSAAITTNVPSARKPDHYSAYTCRPTTGSDNPRGADTRNFRPLNGARMRLGDHVIDTRQVWKLSGCVAYVLVGVVLFVWGRSALHLQPALNLLTAIVFTWRPPWSPSLPPAGVRAPGTARPPARA